MAVGINYILNMRFYKNLKFLFFLTIIFSVLNNVFILIKFHPYQNVFFNSLVEKKANRLFEIDYLGLGNAETLEYLNNNIFYLGQYTKATNLPWHYIPTWIFITLPIFILLFFLVGFFRVLKKFVYNYLDLSIHKA